MMKANEVFREITPLTPGDCFLLFDRNKKRFDFPVHRHHEMELNLILNAGGAKRVVGNHSAEITNTELVLLGPKLEHGWLNHNCRGENIREITIQFQHDILSGGMFDREQMQMLKTMFNASAKGIVFGAETVNKLAPMISALSGKSGFDSVIALLKILHELSMSPYECLLDHDADAVVLPVEKLRDKDFIEIAFSFMNANYQQPLSLDEIAMAVKVPGELLSRMLKRSTGLTFRECLAQIRLGHVSRLLIENNYSVGEIAYRCGFSNLANFNRIFKLNKKCTPKQFRNKYNGNKVMVY
ncbi:AraC family transcriptional regulator [Mucilaginibacter sp. SMC90]|uniref:AraC family transcriptional regulator n=1 Tax=Mucilaginibacter sp. SMC90 TaxID=2929803 RepID=UPI001FB2FA70|nr:AraC family transcriptional regulator [Mucilaginibacter sp. SMC90]UOE47202.1 AraC family transcriptional regulator [Mucilaginibacter sp. SMC90]